MGNGLVCFSFPLSTSKKEGSIMFLLWITPQPEEEGTTQREWSKGDAWEFCLGRG